MAETRAKLAPGIWSVCSPCKRKRGQRDHPLGSSEGACTIRADKNSLLDYTPQDSRALRISVIGIMAAGGGPGQGGSERWKVDLTLGCKKLFYPLKDINRCVYRYRNRPWWGDFYTLKDVDNENVVIGAKFVCGIDNSHVTMLDIYSNQCTVVIIQQEEWSCLSLTWQRSELRYYSAAA